MAEVVASFKAGEAVPEWLFTVAPDEVSGVCTPIVFVRDVHVVETAAGYFLIPECEQPGDGFVAAPNGRSAVLCAASRMVLMPVQTMVCVPNDREGSTLEPLPDMRTSMLQ